MFKIKNIVHKKRTKGDKITLAELVWMGFNYSCGIAFPMALVGIYYWQNGNQGIGLHLLWVIVLCALIALGTAWSFLKFSKLYPGANGGAYVYVRGAFGKFWGWIIGFVQYIGIPCATIVTIISMFRVNLNQLPIFSFVPERWSNLVIDSIGILIYLLASCSMYLGMKGVRAFINISGIIKWASALFLVVCAIILIVNNKGVAYHQAWVGTNTIHLTLPKINNAFSSFFYFFVGFETYVVIGRNVENPAKNFSKGTLIILGLATVFYLVVTSLVIGAISLEGYDHNGWSSASKNYNPNNVIAGIAGVTGMIVLVFSTLSLKLNGTVQNTLYSGAMLEPLAKEGYISEKLAVLNKENIALFASTINLIVTLVTCFIMLIIPDLFNVGFDFNTVLGFTTNIVIFIYIFVLLAVMFLYFKKQVKLNYFEIITFIICLVFLISQFGIFNYGIIKSMITLKGIKLIPVVIEFLMFWLVLVASVVWYYAYYQIKLNKRMKKNPVYQQQLDEEFKINN